MAGENVCELTTLNFEQEVLNSDVPVLVDFAASWCGPCKAIAPFVSQLADEYLGKLKVGTVDIDENSEIAQKFGIRGVPTLYVFKRGEVVGKLVGAGSKQKLEDLCRFHI